MKLERRAKIIELIGQYAIETQDELVEKLIAEGYPVTQATISRDIRELKLTKMTVEGRKRYVALPGNSGQVGEKYIGILKEGFVSMDMAQNILVIKTISGMAMAAAAVLDGLHWQELVGCIAGDDTIFCAVRTVEETRLVMEKLQKMIYNK